MLSRNSQLRGQEEMHVEKGKIICRRADINDVEVLVNVRVRFLNELHKHPDDDETEALRKSLRQYFSESLILQGFQTAKNRDFKPFLFHFLPILEPLSISYITKNAETLISSTF